MDDRLELVADVLIGAESAVAFTGAGVSTASGIPDFHDEEWWDEFEAEDFHVSTFEVDPRGFWRTHACFHDRMYADDLEPNVAHEVLAHLEHEGYLDAVVTQNTDGLHQAGGSRRVVELHGNGTRAICKRCRNHVESATAVERVRDGQVPPRCEHCGGLLRPDVTLFGERLSRETLADAQRLADNADVLLALGSSLSVEPGASVATSVSRSGTLVIVSDEGTSYDDRAAAAFHADVTTLLPRLADLVHERA